MWHKTVLAGLAFGLLLAAAPATAQEPGVEYAKKTVIDFGEVTLEGELTKPEGAYLLNKKKAKFRSLIRVREHFLDELSTSVDNL